MKRLIIFLMLSFLIVTISFSEEKELSSGEKIAISLEEKGLSPELVILIISMLPIVELRGAIPIGINLFGLNPIFTFFLSVFGNMLPIIPILLLLKPISNYLMRFKIWNRFFTWLFERTQKKISGDIEKYKSLGLCVFVAIPLPATGAWTGAVAGFIFGFKFWNALLAILLGVVIAGIIVTVLSVLGWIGALIASLVLFLILIRSIYVIFKRMNSEKLNNGEIK